MCPKFRTFTITFTFGSAAASSRSTATVPSFEALSMKMCSYRYAGSASNTALMRWYSSRTFASSL